MTTPIELPENTMKIWYTEPETDNIIDYIKNKLELDDVNSQEKMKTLLKKKKVLVE